MLGARRVVVLLLAQAWRTLAHGFYRWYKSTLDLWSEEVAQTAAVAEEAVASAAWTVAKLATR